VRIFSLTRVAEEAGYMLEPGRNKLGSIQNPRTFEENFAALDQLHKGIFAFLAFHPVSDKQVAEYVREGSLGSDAGPHILVFFLAGFDAAQAPRRLVVGDLQYGVELSLEAHPAYELAARFSAQEVSPPFPGLIVFDGLLTPRQAIYVPITGSNATRVRSSCRKILDAANASFVKEFGKHAKVLRFDFDRFAARLVELGLDYRRAGERGLRSAAFIAAAWVKKNAGALVSVMPKLLELAAKVGGKS
jgi:hypothetical protein